MLSPSTALKRMDAVRRGLANVDAAAAVLGLSSNLRYLTGFSDEPGERLLCLIVRQEGEPTFVVPQLYADQVRVHGSGITMRVWADGENPAAILATVARELEKQEGRILLDDSLWVAFALMVQDVFRGRQFGLVSEVTTKLRLHKDEDEISSMRRAGEIVDQAYLAVTSKPVCGRSENELAGRLESEMLNAGADGVAFETLVASGPNSALPHYRAGTRRIEPGDAVILDFGCRVGGYCSDISRTIVCGEPRNDMEAVHDAVRRAHEAARERVRSSVQAQEIDVAARGVLTDAGYDANFIHRTGHGIGLDVHEPPYIVAGNEQQLEEGMAFSIEPGAYFAGDYGVRIEDVVVVGEEGAVAMTLAPHDLRCVE
jgi:Xaa-Pro aminopeptidase